MLKEVKKLLKDLRNAGVIVIVGIILTLIGGGVFVYFQIWPQYVAFNDLRERNDSAAESMQAIQDNINKAAALDKDKISSLSEAVSKLLPGKADQVHVASLVQVVASGVGGSISSVQVSESSSGSASSIKPVETTPTPVKIGGKAGGSASTPTPVPTTSVGSYNLTIRYEGTYQSLLDFLVALRQADRAIGVTNVVLNGGGSSSSAGITANLTLKLPLAAGLVSSVSAQEMVKPLTQAEEDEITSLVEKIVYRAGPTDLPLNRQNPFINY